MKSFRFLFLRLRAGLTAIPVFCIRLYQKLISPLKPSSCRFTPTCSSYAIQAFQNRGLICGFVLTVYRILRCNPFCRPGYDPVPLPKRMRIYKPIPKYKAAVRSISRYPKES